MLAGVLLLQSRVQQLCDVRYNARDPCISLSFLPLAFVKNRDLIFNFVDTPRNFIIAKLSIRKPGSSSVLIKSDLF